MARNLISVMELRLALGDGRTMHDRMGMNGWLIGSGLILTMTLIVAVVLGPGRSQPTLPPLPVTVSQEPPGAPSAPGASLPGVVIASESVDVGVPFEGRLEKIGVQVGDTVTAGAVLGQLELHSLQYEVEMAEARLAAVRVQAAQFELELTEMSARLARMLRASAGTFPEEELALVRHQEKLALNRLEAGRAALQEQQAALSQRRQRLSEGVLKAPFDARVVERLLDPGAAVRSGMTILRLSRTGPARVRFAIPVERLGEVAVGSRVHIDLRGLDRSLTGRVEHITPEVDSASQMVFAVAALGVPGERLEGIVAGAEARVIPLEGSRTGPVATEHSAASRP